MRTFNCIGNTRSVGQMERSDGRSARPVEGTRANIGVMTGAAISAGLLDMKGAGQSVGIGTELARYQPDAVFDRDVFRRWSAGNRVEQYRSRFP